MNKKVIALAVAGVSLVAIPLSVIGGKAIVNKTMSTSVSHGSSTSISTSHNSTSGTGTSTGWGYGVSDSSDSMPNVIDLLYLNSVEDTSMSYAPETNFDKEYPSMYTQTLNDYNYYNNLVKEGNTLVSKLNDTTKKYKGTSDTFKKSKIDKLKSDKALIEKEITKEKKYLNDYKKIQAYPKTSKGLKNVKDTYATLFYQQEIIQNMTKLQDKLNETNLLLNYYMTK